MNTVNGSQLVLRNHLCLGDALELLPMFPDASFDSIVTDPPYCSGGLTASERARPASAKYVQSGQKIQWPDYRLSIVCQNQSLLFTRGMDRN